MNVKIIPIKNPPRTKKLRARDTDALPGENLLRVYRLDPDHIRLQAWCGLTVTHVTLTFEEVKQLRDKLDALLTLEVQP